VKILSKEIIAEHEGTQVTRFQIHAPDIAQKIKPGQFIVVMVEEKGERIPLTVVDKDTEKGIITLIVQGIGFSTKLMGKLKKGDSLYAIVGPMGNSTEIKKYGKVILVGGGVGIAEIYPLAKALKQAGNHVVTILGARTKELLILEKDMKTVSDESYITTDNGSCGEKGFVTDVLKKLLTYNLEHRTYNLVYAVGPIPMMQKVASVTKEFNVHTVVSLNALMVDATGMCGGCRVKIGEEVKFSCVDGPEFDAHLVDWDELIKRTRVYSKKENHICKLNQL